MSHGERTNIKQIQKSCQQQVTWVSGSTGDTDTLTQILNTVTQEPCREQSLCLHFIFGVPQSSSIEHVTIYIEMTHSYTFLFCYVLTKQFDSAPQLLSYDAITRHTHLEEL